MNGNLSGTQELRNLSKAQSFLSLLINGEECQTVSTNLNSLFTELGLSAPLLLVEYNGTALTRSEWDAVVLAENDRLELMSVAAGG